ncbi:hypothetical protein BGZ46_007959 [Entomortierella lignicola]|nr:hypothetical protein BGZ46_007959 [Entomortierella lignicola]
MQSDHVYRLPVSNIAYHVYNPEDDITRTKAISRRAFKRTMDDYQNYEHLADLFQVEFDKREQQMRERKELNRSLKNQKKSIKRSQSLRSQDTLQSSQPERHSLRRHLRNSSANASNNTIADESKSQVSEEKPSGSLKRTRRNSDISISDTSGYGDDEVKLLPLPPKPGHQSNSNSSRHGGFGLGIHPNDRSLSNSPALPLTPSPRLTPSESRNEHSTTESETGLMIQSTADSSSNSPGNGLTTTVLALPGHMIIGRRKRKQAIPVHPSVVDRIPGITLRIQRERLGDQLQVEILKNVEDYRSRLESDLSPALKLQATQDLRKVKESIESGRPGYATYPAQATLLLHRLEDSPDMNGSTSNSGTSSTNGWNKDTDTANRNTLLWHQSASSSMASLTRASSHTGSVDSLAAMTDLFDARSLPLSWENFSTRECAVNKVVGKHDKDLNLLEEVVQEVITRQHHQQSQTNQERDHESSVVSPLNPQRRPSGISTGQTTVTGASTPTSAPALVSSSTASANARTLKSSGAPSSPTMRSAPTRSTRSRRHVSDQNGDTVVGENELVAHEDIEFVLKQKRRRKLEERRRQGSKASSKDGEDEEDIEDEGERDEKVTMKIEICEELKDMDMSQDIYNEDNDLKKSNEIHSDGDREGGDGDVPMIKANKIQRKRRISLTESDVSTTGRRPTEEQVIVSTRTRGASVRSRHHNDDYVYEGLTSSSDSVDTGDDDDYRDKSYRGLNQPRRKSINMEPINDSELKIASELESTLESAEATESKVALELKKALESKKASESRKSLEPKADIKPLLKRRGTQVKRPDSMQLQQTHRYRLPISVPIVSSEGRRRTKKLWSRGRNSRKEDEVVDTTSDEDSIDEDTDNGKKMSRAKSGRSVPKTPAEITTDMSEFSDSELPIATDKNAHRIPPTQNVRISMTAPTDVSSPAPKSANTSTPFSIEVKNTASSSSVRESGGRTRARARSFSSTIDTDDKTKFFENALEVIDQKRRETLARKRAAREAEERERQELELREQHEKDIKEEKERMEALVQLQQQEKAPKIEASNLPKSSKSLPGRVLRRTKADGSTVKGSVDPDCTSCRLELSADDKILWKGAQESGEIQLPKTWGTHAILCTACRLQYLDHHWRCTACFYVPSKEEMTTASCSRCKAGTWLRENVRLPHGAGSLAEKRDDRSKNLSDISM